MSAIKIIFTLLIVKLTLFSVSAFANTEEDSSDRRNRTHFKYEQEEKVVQKEIMAKAISKIYTIKYKEAYKVVRATYKYAREHRIKPTLALGLIATESGFDRNARSKTGKGYTQVHAKYHRDKIQGRDIFDTEVNIEVGMTILGDCIEKFGDNRRALACYNGASTSAKAFKYAKRIQARQSELLQMVASL